MRRRSLNILITAGATREPIDPVRFITNRASGFLGRTIARLAKQRGHRVCLIVAPEARARIKGINCMPVETCAQMQKALDKKFSWCDCLVMSAAVSDFRPANKFQRKIKRSARRSPILRLKKNPDLLARISRKKGKRLLVGFALESENLAKNARAKLRQKQLDIIVATQINTASYPFGPGKIKALIINARGRSRRLASIDKADLGRILLDSIEKIMLS